MTRWWGVVLMSFTACGDDGAATMPDAALVDAAPDAFACPMGTTLRTGIASTYGGMGGGPRGGIRECVEGRSDLCTTSTASGSFSLCVPTAGDQVVRTSLAGFETALYLYGAAQPGQLFNEIGDQPFVSNLWADSGATFPPTTSGLLFVSPSGTSGPLAGVTVAVSPAGGATVSYGDANQVAHRNLTATSTSGTVYIGNLPAGSYDVTVTAQPAVTCKNRNLAPMGSPESQGGFESPVVGAAVRVPVVAGATTVSFLHCTP